MKITRTQLRRIIREELQASLPLITEGRTTDLVKDFIDDALEFMSVSSQASRARRVLGAGDEGGALHAIGQIMDAVESIQTYVNNAKNNPDRADRFATLIGNEISDISGFLSSVGARAIPDWIQPGRDTLVALTELPDNAITTAIAGDIAEDLIG